MLTGIDTRSDRGGMYTNNRIHDLRSQSKGDHGFASGELARIDTVDVNR